MIGSPIVDDHCHLAFRYLDFIAVAVGSLERNLRLLERAIESKVYVVDDGLVQSFGLIVPERILLENWLAVFSLINLDCCCKHNDLLYDVQSSNLSERECKNDGQLGSCE